MSSISISETESSGTENIANHQMHDLNLVADNVLLRLLELRRLTAPDGSLCTAMKQAHTLFDSIMKELGITLEDTEVDKDLTKADFSASY